MGQPTSVFSLLLIYVFGNVKAHVCTNIQNLEHVELKIRVTSPYFFNTTTTGPLSCVAQCLLRRKCQYFRFDSGECFLYHFNRSTVEFTYDADSKSMSSDVSKWPQILVASCADHTCPDNTKCRPTTPFEYTCEITGCLDPPILEHAKKVENGHPLQQTPVDGLVKYTCDPGFSLHGETRCLKNGTWEIISCRRVTSCADVKECNSESVDGEYWIYLREFQYQRVRVYCHGMNPTKPEEFITLINRNWGEFPEIQNLLCKNDIFDIPSQAAHIGTRVFTKIKINIQTLVIQGDITTFASGTQIISAYGVAEDCYSMHPSVTEMSSCGSKGSFLIDLTHTGFKLDPLQTWTSIGYKPHVSVTKVSDAVIKLKCGGACGGCRPDGPLRLLIYKEDDVPLNTATEYRECRK